MKRFSQKIAKEKAQNQFDQTLDCVLGLQDPDYSLTDMVEKFEQNFEEDLEDMGFNPTPGKIKMINEQYEKLVAKTMNFLNKQYSK